MNFHFMLLMNSFETTSLEILVFVLSVNISSVYCFVCLDWGLGIIYLSNCFLCSHMLILSLSLFFCQLICKTEMAFLLIVVMGKLLILIMKANCTL